MTTAVISLVASILGFIFFLVRRKLAIVKTPSEKLADAHKEISKEIITGDANAANRRLDDWLRQLQGNKQRQGSVASKGGSAADNKS